MHAALRPLVGRYDFAAFCHGEHAPWHTTVRRIQRAQVRCRHGRIIIDVQADAFLQQMMRLLAANLVKIGGGEQPVPGWRNCCTRGIANWPAKALPLMGYF